MYVCEFTENNEIKVFDLKENPKKILEFRQGELKDYRDVAIKRVITSNQEKYQMIIGENYIKDNGDFFSFERKNLFNTDFCIMQDMSDVSYTEDSKTEEDILQKYYQNGFDSLGCNLLSIESSDYMRRYYLVDSNNTYSYRSVDAKGRPKGNKINVINGIIRLPESLYALEKLRTGIYLHKQFAPNVLDRQLALFSLSEEPVKVFGESEIDRLKDFVYYGSGLSLSINFDKHHKLLQLKRNQMAKK